MSNLQLSLKKLTHPTVHVIKVDKWRKKVRRLEKNFLKYSFRVDASTWKYWRKLSEVESVDFETATTEFCQSRIE